MSKSLLCDSCGQEFSLNESDIKRAIYSYEIDSNIRFEVVYFKCPYCGEIFIIQILNNSMKNYACMLKDKQSKWNDVINTNDPDYIKKKSNIYASIQAIKKKAEKEKNRLLNKYGKRIKAYLKAKN